MENKAELVVLANGYNYILNRYFKVTKLSTGVYFREESYKPL